MVYLGFPKIGDPQSSPWVLIRVVMVHDLEGAGADRGKTEDPETGPSICPPHSKKGPGCCQMMCFP
jgi:hypothetical protein